MARRILSIGFGAALLSGGVYGVYHSCFIARYLPFGVLMLAVLGGVIGVYWIWANFLGPYGSEE